MVAAAFGDVQVCHIKRDNSGTRRNFGEPSFSAMLSSSVCNL
jgi:hypothetical protein